MRFVLLLVTIPVLLVGTIWIGAWLSAPPLLAPFVFMVTMGALVLLLSREG